MDDYTERVARGAALLDEQEPGWAARIDVSRLDLESDCQCVLGQLHGSYRAGASLVFETGEDGAPNAVARACGFIVESFPYGWDQPSRSRAREAERRDEVNLRAAWREAIEARLQ